MAAKKKNNSALLLLLLLGGGAYLLRKKKKTGTIIIDQTTGGLDPGSFVLPGHIKDLPLYGTPDPNNPDITNYTPDFQPTIIHTNGQQYWADNSDPDPTIKFNNDPPVKGGGHETFNDDQFNDPLFDHPEMNSMSRGGIGAVKTVDGTKQIFFILQQLESSGVPALSYYKIVYTLIDKNATNSLPGRERYKAAGQEHQYCK